jgi:TP901 family phage tail tape measure protein
VTDRTVTARLRLDATGWTAGSNQATTATNRMAQAARAATTQAQRDAQRTAAAVAGTFSNMARTGEGALRGLDAAATRSSQALARNAAAMTRQTAAAAAAAARATTTAGTTATRATRGVTTAANAIPATFRAGAAAATTALGRIDVAAAGSRAQVARTLLAQRQALTAGVATVTQASNGIATVTASGIAGTQRLSLATRLTLAQAAAASQAAAAAASGTVTRMTTVARLQAAGATNAAAAAAAAAARADANSAALTASAFGRAGRAALTMGGNVTRAAGNAEKSLRATRTASLALVAAFALAVYADSKFETAMSGVKAATQAGAKELNSLRQAAIAAGASTQYSATQAADAETELAKAGVSTADILGGALKGTLNLAAAGQMDVADSAVVAAKAMNSFGLTGKDMAHIADVIAAAAGKSATDVHGMSLAFAQSSLLAHQTGLSLEQTAGSLALFAQNGLVGSDAGTSLKTMLMRLTPQSDQARGMMDKLGFSAYDANGRFVGLAAVADRMQKSFGGLTPEARNAALGVIFGADAIRAATIVTQAGAKGIDTWTRAANDQGYAARYAATQTDNLQGDLRRLKSALETALIQSGTAANGVLRQMAGSLTGVVRWYSSLNPTLQKSITLMAGVGGVVGVIAAGLLLMLPRIMTVRRELVSLGLTAERTRGMMLGLGRLTVVVGALTAMSYASQKISDAMGKAGPNVDKLTNSLVDLANTGRATGEVADVLGKDLDGFGDSVHRIAHAGGLQKVSDTLGHLPIIGTGDSGSLKKAKQQLDAVDQALSDLVSNGNAKLADDAFKKLAKSANDNGTSTKKLMTLLPQYSNSLTQADTQQKLAADSSKKLGDTSEQTADALQDDRTEAEKLKEALDALNGINIDSAQSAIQFRQSLADLKTAVHDNGHSLDITTDKGRKVKQAFLDAAKSALDNADAIATQTQNQQAGDQALAASIDVIRRQMLAMGFQKKTVDSLLASYLKLPAGVSTTVGVNDKATAELESIQHKLAGTKGKSITVKALTSGAEQALADLGFKVTHMKNGTVRISAPTSQAKAALKSLKDYLATIQSKTVTVTTNLVTKGRNVGGGRLGPGGGYADGGVVHAANGLFVPGYAPRRDTVPAMLSPGEGVLVPETVRALGGAKAIAMLNRWGRYGTGMHFADGGTVGGVQHFAGGGFTYTPGSPVGTLTGPDNATERYTGSVQRLADAWAKLNAALADQTKKTQAVKDAEKNLNAVRGGHHTAKQLADAERKLRDARSASAKAASTVKSDRNAVYAADAYLGLAKGAKAPTSFNLTAYAKQLSLAAAANSRWESNLAKIGKKAGADVEDTLRGMGKDGEDLVAALAKASGKTFNDIVANLKKLAPTAKATLADYTNQIKAATTTSKTFQDNLLKLAAMGYGDLAAQLAAQGDDAAAQVAADAVKSPSGAASANAAAKANASTLSSEDLTNAVTLLGVLRNHPGAGISDVLAAGMDWGTVRALAPKIAAQIKAVSGSGTFVSQMLGQGVAMARGGILTQPTTVLAAEAGSVESWIPWNGTARSQALLARTAAAMGYHLVPGGRFGVSAPSRAGDTHIDRSQTVVLQGADRSLGEQRADLLRHMAVVA